MGNGIGIDFGASASRVAIDDGAGARIPFDEVAVDVGLLVEPSHQRQDTEGCLRIESLKTRLGSARKQAGPKGQPLDSGEHDAVSHFRALRSRLEAELGARVTGATVCAPSIYPINQRAVLRSAVEAAGFDNVSVLDESLAAALGSLPKHDAASKVLVYCLGRSFFSVSAVLVEQSRGKLNALSHEGNVHLAGDAFDAAIMCNIDQLYAVSHGVGVLSDPSALSKLRASVEAARILLSTAEDAQIEVGPGRDSRGRSFHDDYPLARIQLERFITPIVDRTIELARAAAETAEWDIAALDHVLVLGRTAQTPLVRQKLEECFGKPPTIAPADAVALGAAKYAASTSNCWRPLSQAELLAAERAELERELQDKPPESETIKEKLAAVHAQQALIHARAGEWQESRKHFQKSWDYDPSHDDVRKQLAQLHAEEAQRNAEDKNWRECRDRRRESLSLDPDNRLAREVRERTSGRRAKTTASKAGRKSKTRRKTKKRRS